MKYFCEPIKNGPALSWSLFLFSTTMWVPYNVCGEKIAACDKSLVGILTRLIPTIYPLHQKSYYRGIRSSPVRGKTKVVSQ